MHQRLHRAATALTIACLIAGSLAGGWHAHPHGHAQPEQSDGCLEHGPHAHADKHAQDHAHGAEQCHYADAPGHAPHRHADCVICRFLAQPALPLAIEPDLATPVLIVDFVSQAPPSPICRPIFSGRPRAPPVSV